ncbi:hypothetical protein, partial [Streptomyces sp. SID10815]|uniref:hypothetical protein n=1 Tax=Streptomyces sp. SID10815 TaxID=2706027 RepID=UPI0013CDC4BD
DTPRRGRRRVVRRAATGFSEPAAKTGEADSPRRPSRPSVAVFQPPVFAEPKFQFQTPQRAAAEAAAEAADVTEPVEPEETEAVVR